MQMIVFNFNNFAIYCNLKNKRQKNKFKITKLNNKIPMKTGKKPNNLAN